MKAARTDCGHSAAWHAAYGCLLCDCTRPGSYVYAPQPDDDGAWTPPGTIGGTWTRLNQRTRLYESWPPPRPTSVHMAEDGPAPPAPAPSPAAAGLSDEDVERVARALWEADHEQQHGHRRTWEEAREDEPDWYRRLAAAAVAEMRPTAAEDVLRSELVTAIKANGTWRERLQRVEALLAPDAGMAYGDPFGRGDRLFSERDIRAALAPVPHDADGGERR